MTLNKGQNILLGKKCLIMRDASQAYSLLEGIRVLGGIPFLVPLISFRKKILTSSEMETIKNLARFNWIIFTSQNGVKLFMEQLSDLNLVFPEHVKVAAIGTKTKQCLEEFRISPSFVPKKFTGDVLGQEIREVINKNDKICIVKGNLARDAAGEELRKFGADVQEIISYETYLPEESKEQLLQTLTKHRIDILIFTSPSTVEHFMGILKEHKEEKIIEGMWIACIGPVTEKALRKFNLPVHICPEVYTTDQLLIDITNFFNTEENRR